MKNQIIYASKSILLIGLVSLMFILTACSSPNNANSGTNAANIISDNTTGNSPVANNPTVNTPPVTNSPAATNPPISPPASSGTKLTDSQYANNAYLISGDSLDATAQAATSGFSIQKTSNPDNTTTISLTSTNPGYTNQTYTLQAGQQLYFIEQNSGDDGTGDAFIGDDRAIIVDAQGYIVQ